MLGCDIWHNEIIFYLFHELVQDIEIELSQMGKNSGNPDLVCMKKEESSEQDSMKIWKTLVYVCLFVLLLYVPSQQL